LINHQVHKYNESETEYINRVYKTDNSIYINILLANFCMPTLFKLKPSTLVQIQKRHGSLKNMLNILMIDIKAYDCNYIILYENHLMASVLIYHESILRTWLLRRENQKYLIGLGYNLDGDMLTRLFIALSIKLNCYNQNKLIEQFPHEIGIILGYPLEDVKEFVNSKGQNYIICGCWKVYHNVERSKKLFELYHRIRVYSVKCVEEGKSLPTDWICK